MCFLLSTLGDSRWSPRLSGHRSFAGDFHPGESPLVPESRPSASCRRERRRSTSACRRFSSSGGLSPSSTRICTKRAVCRSSSSKWSGAAFRIKLRAGNVEAAVNVYVTASQSKGLIQKIEQDADRGAIEKCSEIFRLITTRNSRREKPWKEFARKFYMRVERLARDRKTIFLLPTHLPDFDTRRASCRSFPANLPARLSYRRATEKYAENAPQRPIYAASIFAELQKRSRKRA